MLGACRNGLYLTHHHRMPAACGCLTGGLFSKVGRAPLKPHAPDHTQHPWSSATSCGRSLVSYESQALADCSIAVQRGFMGDIHRRIFRIQQQGNPTSEMMNYQKRSPMFATPKMDGAVRFVGGDPQKAAYLRGCVRNKIPLQSALHSLFTLIFTCVTRDFLHELAARGGWPSFRRIVGSGGALPGETVSMTSAATRLPGRNERGFGPP